MFTEHLLCAKFKAHFKFMILLRIVKSSSTCKVASEIFNTPCIFKICIHTSVFLWVFVQADQICWIHLQLELHSCELSHECWKPLFNHSLNHLSSSLHHYVGKLLQTFYLLLVTFDNSCLKFPRK